MTWGDAKTGGDSSSVQPVFIPDSDGWNTWKLKFHLLEAFQSYGASLSVMQMKYQEHPRDGFEALYYLPLLPSVEHTRGMHFATATIGPARHLAAILLSKVFVGGGASCRLLPSISLLSSTHVWVCKCVCDACNINMRVCVCAQYTCLYMLLL